jgi:hypothetical protein
MIQSFSECNYLIAFLSAALFPKANLNQPFPRNETVFYRMKHKKEKENGIIMLFHGHDLQLKVKRKHRNVFSSNISTVYNQTCPQKLPLGPQQSVRYT